MNSIVGITLSLVGLAALAIGLTLVRWGAACGPNESHIDCLRAWTVAVVPIFALIGAIFAAYFAFGQMRAAQQQLREMQASGIQAEGMLEANRNLANAAAQSAKAAADANQLLVATQRPYLRLVKAEIISPLRRTSNHWVLSIRATFKNGGSTPALKAFPSLQAYIFRIAPWDQLKTYNQGLLNVPFTAPGEMILPGDEHSFEAMDIQVEILPGSPDKIGLYVGVGYYFEPHKERFVTAATFMLRRRWPAQGDPDTELKLATDDELPASELILQHIRTISSAT